MYVQIITNILIIASLYLLVSTSFYYIFTATKVFDLSHAVTISIGAYFTLYFLHILEIPLILSSVIAIGIAVLISLFLQLVIFKQMRKREFSSFAYLVASLGVFNILQNILSIFFGDTDRQINASPVKVGHSILGAYVTDIQIIIFIASLIAYLGTIVALKYTQFGKSLRAISDNIELSNIYGIDSDRIIFKSYLTGSILGAMAGIFAGIDTSFNLYSGFEILLYGIVILIISGIGSYKSLIYGALLIGTIQQITAYYFDKMWTDTFVYIILILFLIWKPLGINGTQSRKVEV